MSLGWPLKRISILLTLTVLMGFGGGFIFGKMNDSVLVRLGIKAPKTRILVEDRSLFPENLQRVLEKETGLQLEVQSFESDKSLGDMLPYFDIFLGSTCLIEKMNLESEDLHDSLPIDRIISPDFVTINQRQKYVVPLLWNYDDKKGFQIISLRIKKRGRPYLRNLAKTWLRKEFIQRWVETTDLATTYMTLDESSLEPELKASWLRTIPLSKLSLLDRTSCEKSSTYTEPKTEYSGKR